ncbi:hypothetical protein COX24_00545 [bacterium (Candidatus Gribaldobacteria) CG23_combo_of_CG06-09_8_20_14_all_37_87_8]|uniref:Uncharacterized protein n=1 Tax=bacterium (Candidatus Gribaldobacteria) CG23_combo_of_CG06-09_8_20_14_all_37_87_8 TaxID=2014278 RepID=A0A2G9ZFP3_9BACT|nr:MAG: hypothetical protein AUJ25_01235 [Parcubacteria group bacterium CG1_02_37_13]PIP31989.1 MAG: hypothetical protein COX24_00545 [bacterium (Candidatus Gribaldobacteria) CG23_combo_of_CG06-09_8_20_14_all_37_87_8]
MQGENLEFFPIPPDISLGHLGVDEKGHRKCMVLFFPGFFKKISRVWKTLAFCFACFEIIC